MSPSAPAIIAPAMGRSEWLMLLALSVLWGGSFVFVGVAVRDLPPLTIVVLRVGLAAIVLLIALRLKGIPVPHDRRALTTFLVVGLLNNALPFTLLVWGQTHIAAGLASILNATTPIWTVLLAHILTDDERMSRGRMAAMVIGFAGVVVMVGPAALADFGTDVLAQFACLAAALSYGLAGIYGRRIRRLGIAPESAAGGQVVASTLMLLPVMLVVDRPWTMPMPGGATVTAILGLALLSTALAYILYFRILAKAGATNLALVTFLVPVSAIALSALILGERLGSGELAGMALIGCGLVAIDGRLTAGLPRSGGRNRRPVDRSDQ